MEDNHHEMMLTDLKCAENYEAMKMNALMEDRRLYLKSCLVLELAGVVEEVKNNSEICQFV